MALRPLALVLLISMPSPLAAQSLGDVARKEAERRQTVTPAARVITNKDLPEVKAPMAGDTPAPAEPAPADPTAAGTPADAADAAGAAASPPTDDRKSGKADVKDESYWAGRMTSLRDELARDRVVAEALQSRINALTTDFVNRDDPAQRQLIAKERQEAIDELDRVQKSIVTRGKAIADLEEEARRAGVPAGWLRP